MKGDGAAPRWRAASVSIVALALVGPSCGSGTSSPSGGFVSPREECLSRAVFGDAATSPYVLPYPVGRSYVVFQTYCGAANHGRDNQLAYDVEMPLESPILAARAGVAVSVYDTYEDSDDHNGQHNYIFIRHDDGTVAFYAHLRQHSARVGEGDAVEIGQHIADCGHLGNPITDLLHFGVYRTWPNRGGDDLPVSFRNAQGPLDERGGLQEGVSYLALPY